MAIEFYKEFGELGYLANYSNHGFWKNGIYYKTVEHYYQSEKFKNPEIKKRIINAKTPKEASTIGRDRDNRRIDDFKKIKIKVMEEGVFQKFLQNCDIRSKLIETRNQEIKEMSTKESFWGVGPNLDGENHIGKILMKVRERVKEAVWNQILGNCKNKKVYVIGHPNPDADSIFSSIILTHILKSFGIEAVFAVRDENFVDKELIKDYLEEEYEVIKDYQNKYFILVDHNDLNSIPKKNVIGSIDHHRITGEVDNLIEIEYASTALLLYDLLKRKYSFTEKEKLLIGLTVLSDTEYLTSSRFTREDQELYYSLDLGIDAKKYQAKYFKTTDFSKPSEENFHEDYKEYNINQNRIKRSMIRSYHDQLEEYFDRYIEEMEKEDIDLLIWCDYEEKNTKVYYKKKIDFPYFTTSTNLVLKYLQDKNIL